MDSSLPPPKKKELSGGFKHFYYFFYTYSPQHIILHESKQIR
jgi:hypothetical protein